MKTAKETKMTNNRTVKSNESGNPRNFPPGWVGFVGTAFAALILVGLVPATVAQSSGVTVDLVIALNVEDRAPVGENTEFPPNTGELVAWTRVTGAANTTIEHVWRHGQLERVIPLDIGGSPWRTWSRKRIPPNGEGEWTVEVRDSEGNVLATKNFTIGEPAG